MPSKGDTDFGRLAAAKGFLSDKIARIYLKKLRQMEDRGHRVSLDSLLLTDRLLSLGQIVEVQHELQRRIQFCPHCGTRHNVITFEPGEKVRCTKCKERFEIVDWSDGVPPRAVVVHTPPSSASSTDLVRMVQDDEPEDGTFLFECPDCGASLTLEDEFCGHCHPVADVE